LENGDEAWSYTYTAPVTGETAKVLGVEPSRFLGVTFDKNGTVAVYSVAGS
jgi:hypothetical protein